MVQRILIVYNPRSSKRLRIRREVIEPLQRRGGYMVGKHEVEKVPIEENIEKLKKLIMDGDLVLAVGGDGTASAVLNAVILSGKDATIGVLGYGNFNDFARMLGEDDVKQLVFDFEKGKVRDLYPLEILLDGEHYRYAACYMTMGMFAESTEAFENSKVRARLKKGDTGLFFSILTLMRWYFANRRREFLPKDIQIGGASMNKMRVDRTGRVNEALMKSMRRVSDVLFVNGSSVAQVMRSGSWWEDNSNFLVSSGRLKGFLRLCKFMLRSMFRGMPGSKATTGVKVSFSGLEEFEIQIEGEYSRVKVKEVMVKKGAVSVKVVRR